ncbi:hypothetical protein OSB04_002875 [Centaurea solstitialis]|uniref:Transposase n=1 Tax=Centaurea solstitialis TaxID=347529 RepID=A0AA38TU51_9ASTR|nr:hypothetical protein OSB04_002875 [Centaurea solstitialis]
MRPSMFARTIVHFSGKKITNLESCPICGTSCWQDNGGNGKKFAHKVMRYFSLTPRLKRMYSSRYIAEDMRWHYSKRIKEGVMRHPTDSHAWKHFGEMYPSFAAEPKNVRLDRLQMVSIHLVIKATLIVCGLLSWSPGKDIDVFMRPLIDELKHL